MLNVFCGIYNTPDSFPYTFFPLYILSPISAIINKEVLFIGERMYRGKNQEYYIYDERHFACFICMAGEVSPEYLKRVFFGDPCYREKGHGNLLGY